MATSYFTLNVTALEILSLLIDLALLIIVMAYLAIQVRSEFKDQLANLKLLVSRNLSSAQGLVKTGIKSLCSNRLWVRATSRI